MRLFLDSADLDEIRAVTGRFGLRKGLEVILEDLKLG